MVTDDHDDLTDLTFLWSVVPDMGTFSSRTTKNIIWIAPHPTEQEDFELTLVSTDSEGASSSESAQVTVRRVPGGTVPTVEQIQASSLTLVSGGTVSLSVDAVDPVDDLTYNWTALANMGNFDGTFSGSGSSVTYNGPVTFIDITVSILVDVSDGVNTISRMLILTITRGLRINADLSTLSVSSSEGGVTTGHPLTPTFDPNIISYVVTVTNSISVIILSWAPDDLLESEVVLSIAPLTTYRGAQSRSIPLSVGEREISLTITAEDGVTLKTYRLALIRSAPVYRTVVAPGKSYIIREVDAGHLITVRSSLHRIDGKYFVDTYELEHLGGQIYNLTLTLRSINSELPNPVEYPLTSDDLRDE